MKRINKLSESLSNKIAAGEVVEGPSSVVKELVENSIDAGATEISIEIEDAGLKVIRISDNGSGIDPDDIPLIFERHATSKIKNEDDLFSISSLGFRGEALASIASVSKVELISRTAEQDTGFALKIYGLRNMGHVHMGANVGTYITVEDLFYNTPARYKFTRSKSSEMRRMNELVYNLSVSHPEIAFRYLVDGEQKFRTNGDGDRLLAIYNVYGRDIATNMLEVDFSIGGIDVTGYISNLNYSRGNRSMQSLFINGRYVKNRTFLDELNAAYKSLIPINRYPACVLFLECDPSSVDVNIHPSKEIVKFEDEVKLLEGLTQKIRNLLYNRKVVHVAEHKPVPRPEPLKPAEPKKTERPMQLDISNVSRAEIVREKKESFESAKAVVVEKSETDEHVSEIYDNLIYVGQVLASYLIFEKGSSIYYVDQHAAHEKILYESFLELHRSRKMVSQPLLMPVLISCTRSEADNLRNSAVDFTSLGFDVEVFDEMTIVMREIPSLFEVGEAEVFIRDVISNGGIRATLTNEQEIISKACKAAIKAMDRLSPLEANSLIESLKTLKDPITCPHGRPIIIELPSRDIEKMFKRI